jgi:tripartite-type tricarboxylate transporter receptor subunit TctC
MSSSIDRRQLLIVAAGSALGVAALSMPALGNTYPNRPVRMLVGFGAGGPGDVLARIYAQKLQQLLGSPIIVDNRPGAAQLVAIRALMSSPPDGYTIMLATGSGLVQAPGVYPDLPYSPLRDFALISMIATTPGILYCNGQLPVTSVGDFIGYAKAHPGQLNYGSAGVGSAGHFQMEYLRQLAGLDLVHVPYRSDQEVAREVMTGALQVALTTIQPTLPLLANGTLRALAVTGARRVSALPDVPSLAEVDASRLRGIDYYTFYGMIGPAGLSGEVVGRLNAALNQIAAMPDVMSQMKEALAFDVATGTPEDLRRYISEEIPKWQEVGRSMNLTAIAR